MALASISTDTLTADGTEQTLDTDTDGKTYVWWLDTTNMTNGDEIELKIYVKVISGGSSVVAYSQSYANIQATKAKLSTPVPALNEIKITLKQTAGTNRDYDWELLSLD